MSLMNTRIIKVEFDQTLLIMSQYCLPLQADRTFG